MQHRRVRSAFPLNDSVGTSTDFESACSGPEDQIGFYVNGQTASFTSGNATPVIVTASDAASVLFTGVTFRLSTSTTYLPSSSSWTISAAVNPSGNSSSALDLINTGNPASGTGFELLIDSTGHFAIHAGNGSGSDSGDVLTSTASNDAGLDSRICFVTWNANTSTFTMYVYDETTKVLTAPQTLTVSSFSAGTQPIGIVYPTSGSGTSAYNGYLEWISDSPTAMSQATIDGLITDMTGTQAPVAMQTPNPNAPTTHLASDFAHVVSFDTEFDFARAPKITSKSLGPSRTCISWALRAYVTRTMARRTHRRIPMSRSVRVIRRST